jgi:allantoin racemase
MPAFPHHAVFGLPVKLKTHIRIVTPHTTPRPDKLEELAGLDGLADVHFSHVGLEFGPASIEGEYDGVLCAPYVVGRCIEAQQQGVDAVIIDCMGDPGLAAAREAVSIPILGPGEASMHVATMLGHRYGVVTILDRVRSIFANHARICGTYDRLACVRSIDIPVLEIADDNDKLVDALITQSVAAIVDDKADVIILGCTGFPGVSERIVQGLRARRLFAPVINPLRTTAMLAFALSSVGLSSSPLAYPAPRRKQIKGYDLPPLPTEA